MVLAQQAQTFRRAQRGHVEIENDDVGHPFGEHGHEILEGARNAHFGHLVELLQRPLQATAEDRVIVGNQEAQGSRCHPDTGQRTRHAVRTGPLLGAIEHGIILYRSWAMSTAYAAMQHARPGPPRHARCHLNQGNSQQV